jgi:hypothetical protein
VGAVKRRNFLKGAAAGIASPLALTDLLASLKIGAQTTKPQIENPDRYADAPKTEFYVDGYQVQNILSVSTVTETQDIGITTLDSMSRDFRRPALDYSTFDLSIIYEPGDPVFVYMQIAQRAHDTVKIAFNVDMFVYECEAIIAGLSVDAPARECVTANLQFRTTSPVLMSER